MVFYPKMERKNTSNKNLYGGTKMIVELNLVLAETSEAFRIEFARMCETPEVLAELAKDSSTSVVVEVAQNSFTQEDVLLKLARMSDATIQQALVRNPFKSKYPKVIRALVLSEYQVVRMEMAENTADQDILELLSKDCSTNVRQKVAANPATSIKTICKLVYDKEEGVRLTIAKLKELKQEVRQKLSEDSSYLVRMTIAGRSDLSKEELQKIATFEKNAMVLKMVAKNSNTDATVLELLARKTQDVWKEVAENPNTSEKTLSTLVKAQSVDVLLAVIKNKNTSESTLETLRKHEDYLIGKQASYYLHERFLNPKV